MGDIVNKHSKWVAMLPRVEPFYGAFIVDRFKWYLVFVVE
jgi:hypothetical protein